MNPIVISTTIASAAFIISIFAANWLNQRHLDKLMEVQNKRIDDLKEFLTSRIAALEERMGARFDTVTFRLDAIERRLTELEQRNVGSKTFFSSRRCASSTQAA